MSKTLIDALNWRFAIKSYDPTKKISEKDLKTLLEALRLSPSSFGLQPWKFLIIEDRETRKKLCEAAWGQAQITDASHFIVLTRRTNIDQEHVQQFVESTAKAQGKRPEELDGLKKSLLGFVQGTPAEGLAQWASEQVYIALGVLVTTAATMEIDASPMGGFDKAQFDEILGLKAKKLASVVVCALGYRSAEDTYHKRPKSRFAYDDLIEVI